MSEDSGNKSATITPAKPPPGAKSSAKSSTQAKKKSPKKLPPFHVVLLNDDDHSYEYVIEMLRSIFGHNDQEGFRLADEVDKNGRAIVYTTHKELAELKRDQIHGFGRDSASRHARGQ